MASGSESLAAKAGAEEVLPSFDDVFDNTSWEARLELARAKRDAAIAEREGAKPDDVARSIVSTPENATAPDLPASAPTDPATSVPSLKDVLKTGNLNDRLELAQQRHAQIQENTDQRGSMAGFSFSPKSTAEFKKVVLFAKSGANSAAEPVIVPDTGTEEPKGPSNMLVPVPQTAITLVQAPGEMKRGRRSKAALLLLFGLIVGVTGGVLLSQRSPELIAGIVPKSLLPATPIAEYSLPDGVANSVADLSVPTIPEAATQDVFASAKLDPSNSTEVLLALKSGTGNDPLPAMPGPLRQANSQSGIAIAGYQPRGLEYPVTTTGVVAPLLPWQLATGFSGGVAPAQPSFLDGVSGSIQISAFQVQNLTQPLAAFDTGALGTWVLPAGQGAADWNGAFPPLATEVVRVGFTSPLAVPVAADAIALVPAAFEPVELLSIAPVGGLAFNGLSQDFHGHIPALDGPVNFGAQLVNKPYGPSAHGAVPEMGSAPVLMASLETAVTGTDEGLVQSTNTFALAPHSIRVFAPAKVPETEVVEMAAKIGTAGFEVGSVKAVGFTISSDNIRFYHSEDAETAQALADLVNAKVRDFTNFSPKPATGTVELWMAGSAPKSLRRRVRRSTVRNTNSDAALQALRDRLVQRMQRGDHIGGG